MTLKLSATQVKAGMPKLSFHLRPIAKTAYEYDKALYKERQLSECFIGKLKHVRRCFARFDKLARNYLSFLQFASTLIWLR